MPLYIGGAQRVSITIAKRMAESGYNIHFVLLGNKDYGDDLIELIPKQFSISVFCVKKIYKILWIMINEIRRIKPDFAYSSLTYLNILLIIANMMLLNKTKIIVRSNNYLKSFSKWHKIGIWIFYGLSYKIITQNEEMLDELKKYMPYGRSKIISLFNPIDKEYIDSKIKSLENPYKENKGFIFLNVGSFKPSKGQDILIDAFNLVLKKYPNSYLYLVGDYNNHPAFNQIVLDKIKLYDLGSKVVFTGYTDNPYIYMKYADCFVLSSREEGLPNVLLEASYLGAILIAIKCIPVIGKIIKHGVNGFVVETSRPKDLSDCMIRAIEFQNFTTCSIESTKEDILKIFK